MRYRWPWLALALVAAASPPGGGAAMREAEATGSFEVTLTPGPAAPPPIGAMTIAKRYRGGLDATGDGLMLAVRSPGGSAGYVAMEHVAGTLDGRRGGFVLQHSGTMADGGQALSVAVVPGSGTDGLAGLSGTMAIRIEDGRHLYAFRYALPAPPTRR